MSSAGDMPPTLKLKAILDQSEVDVMMPVDDTAVLSDTDKVRPPPPHVYHSPKLSNAPVPSSSGAKENASARPMSSGSTGAPTLPVAFEFIVITSEFFLYEILFLHQTLDVIPTDHVSFPSWVPVCLPVLL
jgi:hypothetical protein